MQTFTYFFMFAVSCLMSLHLTEGAYLVWATKVTSEDGVESQYCDVRYLEDLYRLTDEPLFLSIKPGGRQACFRCSACKGHGSICSTFFDQSCEELKAHYSEGDDKLLNALKYF